MIKRQSLCFLSRQIAAAADIAQPRAILINRGVMALLNKDPFTAYFHGFSHSGQQLRARFPTGKKVTVDVGSSQMTINANNGLSLKGCSDGPSHKRVDDGFLKPHALAPPPPLYPQLVHDSDPRLEGNKDVKLIYGRGMCERGSPLGILDHPMREKLVVAVDVDEVLGSFVSALNKFIADRYSLNHSVSEYHVYEFFKMPCSELLLTESFGSCPIQEMAIDWKVWTMGMCTNRMYYVEIAMLYSIGLGRYGIAPAMKTGIHPIPGALVALHKLSTFCSLSVVTSRQNAIKDHTIDWIEKHYPGLFKEIHFGNHFALDGKSKPKSEICRSLGAHVLIDDNPRYAIECAEVGIKVLLFDYENSYPWCKMESATLHPLITKVHNWDEVEQQLVSWIMF